VENEKCGYPKKERADMAGEQNSRLSLNGEVEKASSSRTSGAKSGRSGVVSEGKALKSAVYIIKHFPDGGWGGLMDFSISARHKSKTLATFVFCLALVSTHAEPIDSASF